MMNINLQKRSDVPLLFLAKFYIRYDVGCHIYCGIVQSNSRFAISQLSAMGWITYFRKNFYKFLTVKSIDYW